MFYTRIGFFLGEKHTLVIISGLDVLLICLTFPFARRSDHQYIRYGDNKLVIVAVSVYVL